MICQLRHGDIMTASYERGHREWPVTTSEPGEMTIFLISLRIIKSFIFIIIRMDANRNAILKLIEKNTQIN